MSSRGNKKGWHRKTWRRRTGSKPTLVDDCRYRPYTGTGACSISSLLLVKKSDGSRLRVGSVGSSPSYVSADSISGSKTSGSGSRMRSKVNIGPRAGSGCFLNPDSQADGLASWSSSGPWQGQRDTHGQHGQRISRSSAGRPAHLDEAQQVASIHVVADAHRHVPQPGWQVTHGQCLSPVSAAPSVARSQHAAWQSIRQSSTGQPSLGNPAHILCYACSTICLDAPAVGGRGDAGLHLHGAQHQQRLTCLHVEACTHVPQ